MFTAGLWTRGDSTGFKLRGFIECPKHSFRCGGQAKIIHWVFWGLCAIEIAPTKNFELKRHLKMISNISVARIGKGIGGLQINKR